MSKEWVATGSLKTWDRTFDTGRHHQSQISRPTHLSCIISRRIPMTSRTSPSPSSYRTTLRGSQDKVVLSETRNRETWSCPELQEYFAKTLFFIINESWSIILQSNFQRTRRAEIDQRISALQLWSFGMNRVWAQESPASVLLSWWLHQRFGYRTRISASTRKQTWRFVRESIDPCIFRD